MGFAIDKVGQESDEREFKVEADRAKAYAAATNDPIPAHTTGELAPPVFSVVPVWDAMGAVVGMVTPAEAMPFVVHGEQDMYFHQPIKPGMVLRSKGAPIGVHVKSSGTTVVSRFETRDEAGELVNEQYSVTFFRGVSDGESKGEEAPAHRFPEDVRSAEPVAVVSQAFDKDQTYRYSDASGDTVPIHLDEEFAKSVGLPGIIIHGLCTMAFTSWAAIQNLAAGDPTRLKRLAVRFSKPVLPGQEVTTRFWRSGEHNGVTTYAYETTNPDGDVVIKDGVAEIKN
ncbi:MAG TPA: MaoC/PaaZ C-terminal domain-containing protein [Acidimicrobiia bacterium]|nr:MaoC/PaaZ C-terminal domain-containing protein [Acidimicrobiia bacterium]